MKYIISAILILNIGASNASITFQQAIEVYSVLVEKNNLVIYPNLRLSTSREINAYTTPGGIIINDGMLAFVNNQEELALVLGHEIGHFKRKDKVSSPGAEYAADALAAIYADRAGYDHCIGSKVIYRFHSPASSTHPDSYSRYMRLKCLTYLIM